MSAPPGSPVAIAVRDLSKSSACRANATPRAATLAGGFPLLLTPIALRAITLLAGFYVDRRHRSPLAKRA